MASEDGLVRGVILRGAGETRIVPLDGGEVLRDVGASPRGAAALGFDEAGYAGFLERIRLAPHDTLHAAFDVVHGAKGRVIIGAAEVRPATGDEVRAAIRAGLESGLAALRDRGIGPTMSAEELMALTRGEDDGPDSPAP